MALIKVDAEPGRSGSTPPGSRGSTGTSAATSTTAGSPGWLSRSPGAAGSRTCRTTGCATSRPGCRSSRDTLWRIYSMTKPITSVAAMMLYEEGAFELTDPVSAVHPVVRRRPGVRRPGRRWRRSTVPATEPVRIWHLLTHTSGPHLRLPPRAPGRRDVPAARVRVRRARRASTSPRPATPFAELPLLFQPGTEWNYSVSTDVLGRVVEVASGQPLDEFLAEHILGPLGMDDTGWSVGRGRPSTGSPTLYMPGPDGALAANAALGEAADAAADCCSPAAGGWSRPPATTTGSPRCCCAAASSTVSGCSARAPSPT